MTFRIGSFEVGGHFFLAPLAGITDRPFRRLCREQGAAFVYSEMVSAKGLWYKDQKSFDLLKTCSEEAPIGFQLFGSDPEIMGEVTEQIETCSNVLLDVNMGCPVSKVVRNGEGSALLKTPELAAEIVAEIVKHTSKPVTAKIRMGWDDSSVNAVSFAQLLESAGAAAISVHGRTREQFYGGQADWNIIGEVKSSVKIPVLGSGDVFTAEDAVDMLKQTGCDGVLIARGALGNPWIFREAESLLSGMSREEMASMVPSLFEIAEMFVKQLELTAEEKGEYVAVREMRKHTGWYFKGQAGVTRLKTEVNHIRKLEELTSEIRRFANME
ncbi:MAG: tRNA dihydrouridine synthase DusB [Clostridiales Family XIII bacterium]|jgi:tRNA-dihydrouridine synthase B|nr:tRNA dihydrouridine synthase DusB [Clostridiales Family XIII bacterium]